MFTLLILMHPYQKRVLRFEWLQRVWSAETAKKPGAPHAIVHAPMFRAHTQRHRLNSLSQLWLNRWPDYSPDTHWR
jgi:hypothetical protein